MNNEINDILKKFKHEHEGPPVYRISDTFHIEYWKTDERFYLVFKILGYYEASTAKYHYKEAMKLKKMKRTKW